MAYIFFDIDGTLWDEKMQIPESTIPTIKQLQKNGHKTFLCSGRSRSNINDKRLLGIGFDGIVAACGNHVEMDGKVLYENILSPELTEKIVRVMEECRMPIVLEGPITPIVFILFLSSGNICSLFFSRTTVRLATASFNFFISLLSAAR